MLVFLSTLKHQLSVCLLFNLSYYLCSPLPTGNFQMRPQTHYLRNWIHLFPAVWEFPEFCLWVKSSKSKTVIWFCFPPPPSHLVSPSYLCFLSILTALFTIITVLSTTSYSVIFWPPSLSLHIRRSGRFSHIKSCSELLLAFRIQTKPSSKVPSCSPPQHPASPLWGSSPCIAVVGCSQDCEPGTMHLFYILDIL